MPYVLCFSSLRKYSLMSKRKKPKWRTVCNDTLERSCDLTALNLHYLGIYMLRVQASANRQHSAWVQKEFCPDKDGKRELIVTHVSISITTFSYCDSVCVT